MAYACYTTVRNLNMEYCSAVRVKDKCFMGKSKRKNSIRARKRDNTKDKRKERRNFGIA